LMSRTPLQGRRAPAALAPCLLTLAALAAAGTPAAAGVIVDHLPAVFDPRYDRFASGFPTAPVPNPSPTFIGSGLDLSCVGLVPLSGTFFSVGMVSERHFIAAAHSPPGPGTQLSFYDPVSNVVRNYTVQSAQRPMTQFVNSQGQTQSLPADVYLGTLTAPIPASDHIT